MLRNFSICSKVVIGGVLWKWVLLTVLQDPRESTCAGVSGAGVFPVSFPVGFYRTPLDDRFCLFIL